MTAWVHFDNLLLLSQYRMDCVCYYRLLGAKDR